MVHSGRLAGHPHERVAEREGGLARRRHIRPMLPLLLVVCGPLHAADQIVPIVAHLSGQKGSVWRSDLKLYNGADRTVSGAMVFTPRGQSAADADMRLPFSIPAGTVKAYTDVYAAAHPGGSGVDRVRISMDLDPTTGKPFAAPVVDTSTYNAAADGGEFGQNPTVFGLDSLWPSGGAHDAILGKAGERDGLIVSTGGEPVTIEWTYAEAGGGNQLTLTSSYGADMTFQYPGGVKQLLGFDPAPNATLAATIITGAARVALTHNNNQTNDPRWVDFTRRAESQTTTANADRIVPIVAHVAGQLGSVWRSDLKLYNPYPWPLTGTLVFTPRKEPASAGDPTLPFSLPPRSVQVYTDIYAAVHAGASGADRVLIRMDTETATGKKLVPPVVDSCTYNLASDGGEFGQNPLIGTANAAAGNWLVADGEGVLILGKSGERDGLFVSTADEPTTIEWTYADASGGNAVTVAQTYAPDMSFQYTGGVKELLGFDPAPDGTLRGAVVAGKARLALTHNNNQTNDPRWVSATPLPVTQYDGEWNALLADGGSMSFTVTGGVIESGAVITMRCNGSLLSETLAGATPLTGSAFGLARSLASPATHSIAVEGAFDTIVAAHGTVARSDCAGGAVTWAAARRGAVTREPLINGFERVTIQAPSLGENRVGAGATQQLYVFLPPSYATSQSHYPVVYYLHSYGAGVNEIYPFGWTIKNEMETGACRELIIVAVSGNTRLSGSFWVDSPVTGSWEQFVVRDVIPLVDATFRTDPRRQARGFAGFSMGGFAALNLAMRHPALSSLSFALAPGLFDANGLREAMPTWTRGFQDAYGAAFAPDLALPYPHAAIPRFDGSTADNAIVSKWEKGFGDLEAKVAAYLGQGTALEKIAIVYGQNDSYRWIPKGCRRLAAILASNGVPHTTTAHSGGHVISYDIVKRYLLPFFNEGFQLR